MITKMNKPWQLPNINSPTSWDLLLQKKKKKKQTKQKKKKKNS